MPLSTAPSCPLGSPTGERSPLPTLAQLVGFLRFSRISVLTMSGNLSSSRNLNKVAPKRMFWLVKVISNYQCSHIRMARNPSPEIDELFNEVYEPPKPTASCAAVHTANKRPFADNHSTKEDETPNSNVVPTDFTSREARVWEAKSKAIERNWKKIKEEEMIYKICGEAGHFTQVLASIKEHQEFTINF